MAYSVQIGSTPEKSLAKIDRSVAVRIKAKILALAEDPRPSGCAKLKGFQDLYRIRIGNYRVVYRIDDGVSRIEVTIIAHRREVYRDL